MSEEYPEPVTGALIFGPKERVFLMKSPKWENKWIVPGGHVEKGESIEECVKREVKEETGLSVFDIKFLKLLEGQPEDFERDTHFIFLNYTCRTQSTDVELDQREGVEHRWIEPEKAVTELELNDSTKEFIEEYLNS